MPDHDHVSLQPAAFQILVALAGGSRHGYAIIKDVAAATSGEIQLYPGTLYTTIRRLLTDGLIREVSAPRAAGSSDERRRYYEITAAGRRAARSELERLQNIVRQAAPKLASS